MSELRFYYKKKDGSAYLSLKTPDYDGNEDYVRISEREWNEHLEDIEPKEESEDE